MNLLFTLQQKLAGIAHGLLFYVMLINISVFQCYAQLEPKPKGALKASIYPSLPYEYSQLGSTTLYYKQYSGAIDIIGQFADLYYSSTYSDAGYRSAMKVGEGWAVPIDSQNGTSSDGVNVTMSIEEYNGLAQFKYTVTNTNTTEKSISLGSRADVMIGNNDQAPISRKKYLDNSTYGLQMSFDHSEVTASLVLLFGSGMEGIVPVDDYWFGHYSNNNNDDLIVGNYTTSGNNLYEENGSYDSGLGWCWKNRVLPPNSTSVFSVLIGVGDVTLLPMAQKLIVSAEDTTNWNDLSQPHQFKISGTYFSPASQKGVIYYSVDNNDWILLTDSLNSETPFENTITATFSTDMPVHSIRICARDQAGASSPYYATNYKTTSSLLVRGVTEMEYSGEPITQPSLQFCDPANSATLTEGKHYEYFYANNLNAGRASIHVNGLYPYSIGKTIHNFTILPTTLSGKIVLPDTSYVYTGAAIIPDIKFDDTIHGELTKDVDYQVSLEGNIYPGSATVKVLGIGNYKGEFTKNFEITKKSIEVDSLHFTVPSKEIYYDGAPHPVSIELEEGMGACTIFYTDNSGNRTTEVPVEPGDYRISFIFEEGAYYMAASFEKIAGYSILVINQKDWNILKRFHTALGNGTGWKEKWNITDDIKSASNLYGVTLANGHVTELCLPQNNLTGNLPFEVFTLPYLVKVDLSNNELTGDIGNGMTAAMTLNQTREAKATNINMAGNRLSGNIGVFAKFFPALTALLANNNRISDVLPILSPTITELDLSEQAIDKVVLLDWGKSNIETVIATLPTICMYNHNEQNYKSEISWLLSDSPVLPDWQVSIGYSNHNFSIKQLTENNAYTKQNGDTIYCTNLSEYGKGSTFRLKFTFTPGDANFTGDVNILDLQAIIKFIFDEYKSVPFNHTAANLQKDNLINVQDIVCLVDILQEQDPLKVTQLRSQTKTIVNSQASLFIKENKLMLTSQIPVSALDIILTGCQEADITWQLGDMGFIHSMKSRGLSTRAIIYSLSGGEIPAGETVLATLSDTQPQLQSALLSDVDAQEITVSLLNSGQPTDIGSIKGDFDCKILKEGVELTSGRPLTNIQCSVYSPDGRLITGTHYQKQLQGTILLPWQTYLPNGCYIIRVQADNHILKTMKITIIK